MVAGGYQRLCTAILRASNGRLFPKVGAEGVYAVGRRSGPGAGDAFAVKIDDGGKLGLEPLVVDLLERFGWLDASELASLESYRDRVLKNRAGLVVGRTDVVR
jgi:L-asparaginase II